MNAYRSMILGLAVTINLVLIVMIFSPQAERVIRRIEQNEAVPAGAQRIPRFHDYYYDYLLVERQKQGEWQVEIYREVQVILDENGRKLARVETGNLEYVRYWDGY